MILFAIVRLAYNLKAETYKASEMCGLDNICGTHFYWPICLSAEKLQIIKTSFRNLITNEKTADLDFYKELQQNPFSEN
jgi:hypothetical protein